MRLLLDTHIWLWLVSGDRRLSARLREAIEDASNDVFFSVASGWEIAIKFRLGKLPLPMSPRAYIQEMQERAEIATLPVELDHATAVGDLPEIHRDPFDRLLVAQSMIESLTIVTVDAVFRRYAVSCMSA